MDYVIDWSQTGFEGNGDVSLFAHDFIDHVLQNVVCKKCAADLDYAAKEVVGDMLHLHVACKNNHLWHHIAMLYPYV